MDMRSNSDCRDNLPRAFTNEGVLLGMRRLLGRLDVVGARIVRFFAMSAANMVFLSCVNISENHLPDRLVMACRCRSRMMWLSYKQRYPRRAMPSLDKHCVTWR